MALSFLRDANEEFFREFTACHTRCDYMQVVHHRVSVQLHNNHFSRAARIDLLKVLQAACLREGVDLQFNSRIEDATALSADLERLTSKLEHIVAELRRAHFGRKFERITDDQLALALDELETAAAKVNAEAERADPERKAVAARKRRASRDEKLDHSPIATEALARINELYAVETEMRGLPPELRRRARQERTKPLVEALKPWFEQSLAAVPKGGRIEAEVAASDRPTTSAALAANSGSLLSHQLLRPASL